MLMDHLARTHSLCHCMQTWLCNHLEWIEWCQRCLQEGLGRPIDQKMEVPTRGEAFTGSIWSQPWGDGRSTPTSTTKLANWSLHSSSNGRRFIKPFQQVVQESNSIIKNVVSKYSTTNRAKKIKLLEIGDQRCFRTRHYAVPDGQCICSIQGPKASPCWSNPSPCFLDELRTLFNRHFLE